AAGGGSSGKLMGRLAIDELVDVGYEGTDTDLRRMGGVGAEEGVFSPAPKGGKTRRGWLAINLGTAVIGPRVIDGFEHTISQQV
ncbi:hypothetical protein AAY51_23700, partial [Vibrio parahaemolyticus]